MFGPHSRMYSSKFATGSDPLGAPSEMVVYWEVFANLRWADAGRSPALTARMRLPWARANDGEPEGISCAVYFKDRPTVSGVESTLPLGACDEELPELVALRQAFLPFQGM